MHGKITDVSVTFAIIQLDSDSWQTKIRSGLPKEVLSTEDITYNVFI